MYRFSSVKPCPWTGELHVSQSLTVLFNTSSEKVTHSVNLTMELGNAETYEDISLIQRNYGTS